MIIEYKGKKLDTVFYKEMSDQKFQQLRAEHYKKPKIGEVKEQILKLDKGGVKHNLITKYYFQDLIEKTVLWHSKWSIEDVFEYKPLLCFFYDKTTKNKKVYPEKNSDIKNIETALRLGGKGVAAKPSDYPLKNVLFILEKYNTNGNYYDFSCGWGVRLMGSLIKNINYYGTDPNYLLTEKLEQFAYRYKCTTDKNVITDIRTQGSEIHIPEWDNKMGLAFSSPPYFKLEDYKVGDGQSINKYNDYTVWKEKYLKPTLENVYKYLIKDGFMMFNINDYQEYNLVKDSKDIAESVGFTFVEYLRLENIKRANSNGGFNDNSEKIMVFKKIN